MSTKTFKIAAVAAAIASMPLLAQAGTSSTGYESCVKAFVASLSGKYSNAPKLKESRYIDRGGVGAPSELTMIARNANGNKEVARATCTVDTDGAVVALRDEPVNGLL